jgi:hypothetical protein
MKPVFRNNYNSMLDLKTVITGVCYEILDNGIVNVFFGCPNYKYFEDMWDYTCSVGGDIVTVINFTVKENEETGYLDSFELAVLGEYEVMTIPLKHQYLISFIPRDLTVYRDINKFTLLEV